MSGKRSSLLTGKVPDEVEIHAHIAVVLVCNILLDSASPFQSTIHQQSKYNALGAT